ncbi:hypothetical protein [Streptomyces sp. NPDC005752]|uniref:hypothetical protein n=1 Tax=Streptomyces sp. NPDC005752 TaxID=3157065 RepID=UPI0033E30A52
MRVDDVRPLLGDPSAEAVRQATAALPSVGRPQGSLCGLLAEDDPHHQWVAAILLLRAARMHAGAEDRI